ncbi:hypothetical protein TRVL_00169 [Trypanosoma vivax]|nr:hypothetical protein TRVL_00169 [Trypanosoma vivax]
MSKRERSATPKKKAKRRKRGGRRVRQKKRGDNPPPVVPSSFACHICTKNHWTVSCPRLLNAPGAFPHMDPKKGCWRCAQRGHSSIQCPVKKHRCSDCGGIHDTRDCEFDHKSEEWHEFYDTVTRHVFYCNSETREVQWMPPSHRLDVVLWYCTACSVLLPTAVPECVKCHVPRPESQISSSTSLASSTASCSSMSSDDGNESDKGDDSASSCAED